MKNLFIFPTLEKSNIYLYKSNGCYFAHPDTSPYKGSTAPNQYLYITNDEEIKVDDWVISENFQFPLKVEFDHDGYSAMHGNIGETIGDYYSLQEGYKKIVLTNDLKLIEAGIQVLEFEFIEWFTKNNKTEFVQIDKHPEFYNLYIITIKKSIKEKKPKINKEDKQKEVIKQHLASFGYNLGDSVPVETLINEIIPELLKKT